MWVKFKENFEWRPTASQIYEYKSGGTYCVTHVCGREALNQNKAIELAPPAKENENGDKTNNFKPRSVGNKNKRNPKEH